MEETKNKHITHTCFFNVIVLLGVFLLPFLIPRFSLNINSSSILTFVTLFFAILVGFFIAAATSNYLRMQTLISSQNATLISIYNFVKNIDPSKTKKIATVIDNYMVKILDYELLDYVPKTEKEFLAIIQAIDDIKIKNNRGENLLPHLLTGRFELFNQVQEMTLVSKTIVSPKHWFILTSLAFIISVLLLELRDGALWTSIFTSLVFVAIYQTLVLIYEIDKNIFLANKLSYENPQQVFCEIGKPNYYPETAIAEKLVRTEIIEYRVGKYVNYPKPHTKKIYLIKK